MIVVTGAAGFIGSCLISKLNEEGYNDLVLVDNFSREDKNKNFKGKKYSTIVDRNDFFTWLDQKEKLVQFIFHIGARTDTTENNIAIFNLLNLDYSKNIWEKCVKYGLPMIYASSAATYGAGESGYNDDHAFIESLKPLNSYGNSKNEFDKWVLKQEKHPYYWVGLKFFNVYGPNEYHKGRMASVVYHAYNQLIRDGEIKLFKSHRPEYKDGAQKRDFIYVKDVVEVLHFLMLNRKKENNGIYNLGTGKANTFNKLAESIFQALDRNSDIKYIDTPLDIRSKYQYFTEAKMEKLRGIGYNQPFRNLKDGIEDYVVNYLEKGKYY